LNTAKTSALADKPTSGTRRRSGSNLTACVFHFLTTSKMPPTALNTHHQIFTINPPDQTNAGRRKHLTTLNTMIQSETLWNKNKQIT
jgi:hypothetical protein